MHQECTPPVSIIVPLYNVELYLEECIASICNQTFEEIEIILIDDGSLDGCPQMCDQFAAEDQRIRVIHQQNAGVSAARNKGIEQALGQWIMFVDPDDWLERNAVEILYNQVLQCGSDIIVGSYWVNEFHTYGQERQTKFQVKEIAQGKYRIDQDFEVLLRWALSPRKNTSPLQVPWAKFYKRELFRHKLCRFPEGMEMSEDTIFNLYTLWHASSLFFLDIPIYHYRSGRPGAVTTNYCPEQEERFRREVEELRKFFNLYQLWEEFGIYYDCRVVAGNQWLAINAARNVHNLSDFRQAVVNLRRLSEEPFSRKAITDVPVGFRGGVRHEIGLWLLKRRMYRTIMLIRWLEEVRRDRS